MKKHSFNVYFIIWLIAFIIANMVILLVPGFIPDSKFSGSFWLGYWLVLVAFLLEFACAAYAFKAGTLQKMFYRMSLVDVTYGSTILMAIIGGVFMQFNFLFQWLAGFLCIAVVLLNFVVIVKTGAAVQMVEDLDERVKTQTFFIKTLAIDAETLMESVTDSETKKICKKVYEAIRYSDPMSNEALASAEGQIAVKYNEFALAVQINSQNVSAVASELLVLIADRNKKCMLLK